MKLAEPSLKPKVKDEEAYRPIIDFGWEQDEDCVKIRITSGIDGIGTLPKGNISVAFAPKGFDLKIKGLKGANYRLKISPLNKEIKEAESKYAVKSNSITITLIKKAHGNWDDVKEKAPMIKPKAAEKAEMPPGKEEDPQASLMNMMKEMYDSGDDEMKKVIAQSWSKAHEEQANKKEKK